MMVISRWVRIVAPVVLISLVCISCDLFKKKSNLKKAQQSEINGNIAEALALYTEELLTITKALTIPDNNRTKFLKTEDWAKEVANYQLWIRTPEPNVSDLYKRTLDGVINCNRNTSPDNRLVRFNNTILDSNSFKKSWNKTFFAQNVKVDPEHNGMRNASFGKKMSFVTISSPRNYSYNIHVLNLTHKRRIEAVLYPESSVTFMASEGEYLFICKSTVTFESGQIWVSPFTITKLIIPQESSLITADLLTSVSR